MAEHIKQFTRLSYARIVRLLPSRRFRLFSLISLALIVISTVFIWAAPSFAQNVPVSGIGDAIIRSLVWLMLQLATVFIQLTIFLLRFFILIAGYNDYINAPVVLLGWNMLRDIANMFFIVILMVIAFGTMLGLEQYEWRKSLVKLVIAAILVNFSNLIVQVMIDVAQVFTITFLNAVAGAAGGNLIQMFNFDKLFEIVVGSPEDVSGDLLLNLFGAGVISLVFAGMAMFTMLAYVVVLLARMVVLWMGIILSPLMFMFSVLPQTKKYADEYWSEIINHIIAAPVMVFFLWLSFATFGGNQGAIAHIEDNNAIKTAQGSGYLSSAETIGGSKPAIAGISQAGTPENMANFAVALAFLWLGVERVQKLGVKGGSLLSKATNFAGNVATIATGYAAGRWLVGKGTDASIGSLKYVGNRIPLVGGASLKNYGAAISSTFQRKGALGVLTAGNFSGIGGAQSKIRASERAKNWEENGFYKGTGGRAVGWLAARVWEPSERAEKRSQDWAAAAERVKKIQEESYSTSGSRAGQAKLDATVELKKVEEKAAAKGAQKITERLKEAREIKEIYDKLKDQNNRLPADTQRSEKELREQTQEAYLEKVAREKGASTKEKTQRLLERDGGVASRLELANKVATEIKSTVGSKAASEEGDMKERHFIEEEQARARDKIRAGLNLPEIHLPAFRDRYQKEIEESMSGLNFREITRQAGNFMAQGLRSPEIARAAAATLSVAMKRGSETGMAAFNEMLIGLGFDDNAAQNVAADDMQGKQRLLLSALLGERVTETDNLDQKMAEFEQKVGGPEAAQTILKNLDSNLKVAAADGAVNMAGLFDDRTVDANGKLKIKLETDTAKFKGNRMYAANVNNITKATGVEDMIGEKGTLQKTKRDAQGRKILDSAGNAIMEDDIQAQEQLATFLNSAKQNTRFSSFFVESIVRLNQNDQAGLRKVLDKLNQEARAAIEKLLTAPSPTGSAAAGGAPIGPGPGAGP